MDPQQRFYLDALGIQLWERRDAPSSAPEALATQPVPEPVATEAPVAETTVIPPEPVVEPIAKPAPITPPPKAEPKPQADDGIPAWLDEAPPPEVPMPGMEEAFDEAAFAGEHAEPSLPDVATLDWPALQQRVSECVACPELVASRRQPVFGVGNPQADLMIIGEAPDPDEDQQGEPFVGKTGPLFNAMLHAMGFKRQQLYITNVLKCCSPEHRAPKVDELASCEAYIQRQIALVQPKVILLVGRIAAQNLLKIDTPIGKLRGSVHQYDGHIPVVVTYHPGYLLRSPLEKRKSWDDLCLARSLLDT